MKYFWAKIKLKPENRWSFKLRWSLAELQVQLEIVHDNPTETDEKHYLVVSPELTCNCSKKPY